MQDTEQETKALPPVFHLPCLSCGEPLTLPLRMRGKVFVYKSACPACGNISTMRGVYDGEK